MASTVSDLLTTSRTTSLRTKSFLLLGVQCDCMKLTIRLLDQQAWIVPYLFYHFGISIDDICQQYNIKQMHWLSFIAAALLSLVFEGTSAEVRVRGESPYVHDHWPLVFDCFLYDGEDHVLDLKLAMMGSFVDYFVIIEGLHSKNNQEYFKFDRMRYESYSQKILYLPIRNLPGSASIFRDNDEQNQRLLQDSCNQILTVMGHPEDVVIMSEIDEVITEAAVKEFIEYSFGYACTQLKLFKDYLNREWIGERFVNGTGQNLADIGENSKIDLYWHQGARMLTVSTLIKQFKNSSFDARRYFRCQNDFFYIPNMWRERQHLLQKAGWHFSSSKQKYIWGFQPNIKIFRKQYSNNVDLSSFPVSLRSEISKSKYQQYIANISSTTLANHLQKKLFRTKDGEQVSYVEQSEASFSLEEQNRTTFKLQKYHPISRIPHQQLTLFISLILGYFLAMVVIFKSLSGSAQQRIWHKLSKNKKDNHSKGCKSVLLRLVSVICVGFIMLALFCYFNRAKDRRLVIVCNPYMGQDLLLSLKMAVTNAYVDYFVITQGFYTHTGKLKSLRFNFSNFQEYAHKIIYLPLRNFPAVQKNVNFYEKWENQFYMRRTALLILNLLVKPQDILIMEDCDESIDPKVFAQFDPTIPGFTSVELRLFYYYFNRMSVFNANGTLRPNNWYTGSKIITFQNLKSQFNGDPSALRRALGCQFDVLSRAANEGKVQTCKGPLFRNAGWHFTYILNNEDLQRKLRAYADTNSTLQNITNFTALRQFSFPPNASLTDLSLFNGEFPEELVRSLYFQGKNSPYAPYWSNFSEERMKQQGEEFINKLNQKPAIDFDRIKAGYDALDISPWIIHTLFLMLGAGLAGLSIYLVIEQVRDGGRDIDKRDHEEQAPMGCTYDRKYSEEGQLNRI